MMEEKISDKTRNGEEISDETRNRNIDSIGRGGAS